MTHLMHPAHRKVADVRQAFERTWVACFDASKVPELTRRERRRLLRLGNEAMELRDQMLAILGNIAERTEFVHKT